ncbi:hypothetical protein LEP1GSC116_1478 [Leptospira interrogans serovar Icterohaemorrhagiae str. Verdun HP]|uniref:Uncharacterized protein n=1 Tax=Leptospira interrogans serovar Icterohaemorrhagiae str. Verdun HP TaxID=1049910 RepID=M6R764_LEPIR|nr:hypothetical protein LEP1GSC116_1478 [Leptospira interrogans serovar Icterohaemorrhagiae str. Verdun HP]
MIRRQFFSGFIEASLKFFGNSHPILLYSKILISLEFGVRNSHDSFSKKVGFYRSIPKMWELP